MKFSLSLSSSVAVVSGVYLYTGVAASPAPVAAPKPVEDWKTAVGWDGTVLESSAIGVTAFKNATTDALEKRNIGGVYICTDINWGGTCGYAAQPVGECIILGSDWSDKISSFGPDECTGCYACEEPSCDEESWEFTYPGDATGGLGTSNPWNDLIAAFLCEPIRDC